MRANCAVLHLVEYSAVEIEQVSSYLLSRQNVCWAAVRSSQQAGKPSTIVFGIANVSVLGAVLITG